MLDALLRLRQDRPRLRLRVVASNGLLLGQQLRTRGDVSRLSLVVMTIGRMRSVDRHVPSLRRGHSRPALPRSLTDPAVRTGGRIASVGSRRNNASGPRTSSPTRREPLGAQKHDPLVTIAEVRLAR